MRLQPWEIESFARTMLRGFQRFDLRWMRGNRRDLDEEIAWHLAEAGRLIDERARRDQKIDEVIAGTYRPWRAQ